MRNLPEWTVAFYAAELVGAIVTPLNAWWTGPELEYGLVDSGTKIAFVDAERLERISEHLVNCPDLKKIYVSRYADDLPHTIVVRLEDTIGRVNDWGSLPPGEMPKVELHPDDDATILYTSGTTGRPKGGSAPIATCAPTSWRPASPPRAASCAGARRRAVFANPLDAPQRSTLLSVPSSMRRMFRRAGADGRQRRQDRADASLRRRKGDGADREGEDQQRRRRSDHRLADPRTSQSAQIRSSSLEAMAYGGAPSAPELVKQIKQNWPKSAAGNGWGMTETSATCTTHSGEDYENRPTSCGPPVAVCDLKIMNVEGTEDLPVGAVGELWARGPNIVKCYWNKPEATAATFVDGWVKTGDLARLDEEGFCYIIDRAKDMLIRGGENIYCIEVENVLYDHPAVMDAALVPVPHKQLGEEPGAVVHLKPGMHTTEEELRQFVAGKLAAFKVPVKVVFWPETLPRNANGKILKTELKKIFANPQ